MAPNRDNPSIASLKDGETVSGFALLTKKQLRQDKNGRDFYDLELSDATGSMVGKVWSDSRAINGDYSAHDFVAYQGQVQSYRSQLQLNVKECRRVTDADRKHGFDEALLVPTTTEDIDEIYERLESLMTKEIKRPVLQQLATETLVVYGPELREHPAAKTIHHAFRGGLLEHVVSMCELAIRVCDHYSDLDRELILLGVLYHDLGKLRELGAMPVNEYTTEGRLVGHIVIGRDMLRERCEAIPDFPTNLQLHLEHLVLSHQGRREFGSPVEPMTSEALTLHFLDDLDSKLAQIREISESGPDPHWLRGMERFIYRDLEDGGAEADDSDDTEQQELDL